MMPRNPSSDTIFTECCLPLSISVCLRRSGLPTHISMAADDASISYPLQPTMINHHPPTTSPPLMRGPDLTPVMPVCVCDILCECLAWADGLPGAGREWRGRQRS